MKGQTMTAGKSRSGGLLAFILFCLLGSGLFRLGAGNFALAKEVAAWAGPENPAAKANAVPEQCKIPPDTVALLDAIKARNSQLDDREAKLENRLQVLKAAELKLKQNTVILVTAERRLTATLAISDKAAEKDLQRLTAVYENMKTRNAAALFGAMDPEFAAGFLGRMRAEAAAAIMSSLPPEKAYAISLVLAGRNARAPKQ